MKAKLIKMFVLTSWLAVGLLIPATGVHAQPKDEPKGTPVLKPGPMKKETVKSVDKTGGTKPPQSKPNVYRLDSRDANAAKVCTDGGGVVATDKDNQSVCATGYKTRVGRGCSVPPCVKRPGGCICP